MEQLAEFALAAGATARLTMLVVVDEIVEPVRRRLTGFWGALASCAWCSGVWVAAVAVASGVAWGHCLWWRAVCAVLTLSLIAGYAVQRREPARVEAQLVAPATVLVAACPDDPEGDAHST